jgi:SWI/SNF-related matrix-associated actin-dependent regulator 1 of chromatin subfamily A
MRANAFKIIDTKTGKVVTGKVFKVTFSYNTGLLKKIKTIPGRKYHSEEKYWTVPATHTNARTLRSLGLEPHKNVEAFFEQLKVYQTFRKERIEEKLREVGVYNKLYSFQREGVIKIEQFRGRALLADEMGLGKTIQALCWLKIHPSLRPALIICPAVVKYNWKQEIDKWVGNKGTVILQGQKPYSVHGVEVVIINYDIVHYWKGVLTKAGFKALINDECHKIKDNKTKMTKAVKTLAKGIPHIINMSGTPILNRPIEMYNAIAMVLPTLFDNMWHFGKRYCNLKHNGFALDWNGSSNTKELNQILVQNLMIRRKKADVLKDLPDKTYSYVPLKIDNVGEYERAEFDTIQYIKNKVETDLRREIKQLSGDLGNVVELDKNKLDQLKKEKVAKLNPLTKVELLKQVAVKGKLKKCVEWIGDFLESGEKLVVFGVHKFVLDELIKVFAKEAVRLDGSTPTKERSEVVKRFQTDKKIRLFIANVQAGGVGITLTTASNVCLVEFPWTPGEVNQAVDRVHRIGQKNAVNVHYLLGKNTIEEQIVKLIDEKQKTVDAVLDGKDIESGTIFESIVLHLTK